MAVRFGPYVFVFMLVSFVFSAYNGIESLIYALGIDGGDSIARPALAFYKVWLLAY